MPSRPAQSRKTRATRRKTSPIEAFPPHRIRQIAEFRFALRTFQRSSEQAARACALTPQRYLLLLAIKGAADGSERSTMGELAQQLKVSANTLSELADRAEKTGLVRRERGLDDARLTYLRITREGERRLLRALALSDGDRRELARAFDALRAPLRLAAS
jgi:DNA-binding MarR family transcriptional regulator